MTVQVTLEIVELTLNKMTYANIIDGKIIKTGRCPKATKFNGNFSTMPEDYKNQYGWFKVVDNKPEWLSDWQSHMSKGITLNNGTPIQEYEIVTKTIEQLKEDKKEELRKYVQLKFPKTYEQMTAKIGGSYSIEKDEEIIERVRTWNKYIDDKKVEIDLLTTEQEIMDFDVLTKEDRAKADEDLI